MRTIQAIYEGGVFRPLEPVELPEHSRVEFEPRPMAGNAGAEGPTPSLDEVYRLLSARFRSGESDVAARHDEHQP